jgi:ABC-2 type transport system ATP-binding protein
MNNDEIIVAKNISKVFPGSFAPAIKNMSFSIPKKGIVGIAGPDGAGKTTLIRLIAGLLLPTGGTVTVGGFDSVEEAPCISTILGYMPQKFGLYEDLTVMQNLILYADLQGVLGEKRKEMIEKLLVFTNLGAFTERRAGALSGGMKQKLGLACSLLRKPPLLLLDEPSVGVDPLSRRELWKMVNRLAEEGTTVLWSTSYLDEAEKCNTVMLLNEGSILFYGPPQELTKHVEGRVFRIEGISGSRRDILTSTLNQSNCIDGVIQGSDIRFVTKEKKDPPIDTACLLQEKDMRIESAPPRFEDAFIDLLGGGPGGQSALADVMPVLVNDDAVVVEANGLTKKFGSFIATNKISFSVKRGEIFGLLGPNGAGKSTTFKMMCGLLRPTEGNALVNGIDLQKAPGPGRSLLGYMSQKFSLYSILSVKQNLDFFAGIYNLHGEKKQKVIALMVDIFGFKPYLDETVGDLPLGFKQRLALSCAVMHRPKVLFLDEPTSGVDPITRREFWNHINGVVEKGATVVVTTHFMDEAEYCDRIGLVYNSHLIQQGAPDELKELARCKELPSPTLEDAFIRLIEQYEEAHKNG